MTCYEDEEFGGSILEPVQDRQNMLYESILKVRGTHGGYYKLPNVKIGEDIYADIDLLIDWQWVNTQPGFSALEDWHEQNNDIKFKNLSARENHIEWEEIRKFMSGYARVVAIKNNDNEYQMQYIMEGQFKEGKFDGYARKYQLIPDPKKRETFLPKC